MVASHAPYYRAGLSLEHQQQFLMAMVSETHHRDSYIVKEGEQGDRFYVVTHGELVITTMQLDVETVITHIYEVPTRMLS